VNCCTLSTELMEYVTRRVFDSHAALRVKSTAARADDDHVLYWLSTEKEQSGMSEACRRATLAARHMSMLGLSRKRPVQAVPASCRRLTGSTIHTEAENDRYKAPFATQVDTWRLGCCDCR
jgi:hypothetical protein